VHGDARVAGEFPGEGVFACAAADDEDPHGREISSENCPLFVIA